MIRRVFQNPKCNGQGETAQGKKLNDCKMKIVWFYHYPYLPWFNFPVPFPCRERALTVRFRNF